MAQAESEPSKEELADRVSEDGDRGPSEKETGILFNKESDRADVTVAESGLMRRFLKHPDFEVKTYSTDDAGNVIQVNGTIGIEYLSISTKGRSTAQHSQVVSGGVLD